MSKNRKIFEDLFVLEIANNHWGSLQRGFKLVEEFGKVVRQNNVKAAIKIFKTEKTYVIPAKH